MVQVRIEPKNEYLYAKMDGSFDLQSMIHSQDAVMEAGAQRQAKKILVDFRGMTGEISTAERFHFAEAGSIKYLQLVNEGKMNGCKFAYLGQTPQLDPRRYGETVGVNRGVMVKATDSISEAFDWLGIQPDIE